MVTTLRYGAFFTRYAKCPNCSFQTKHTTVKRIRSATTRRSGLEEIVEHCGHCGHSARSTRVIPKRVERDSSFSWSSSSSGGGSSSGSGASGSW